MKGGPPKVSDEEFIRLFQEYGSVSTVAKAAGIELRYAFTRRRQIEQKHGIKLASSHPQSPDKIEPIGNGTRAQVTIENGIVMVGSDCHYRPGVGPSTAHRAFVMLAKRLNPTMVVINGDAFDFPGISRHARVGWTASPTVKDELEEVQTRLHEIWDASKSAKHMYDWGNHCLRFDGKLSNILPQYEGIAGTSLADHLPGWSFQWAIRINEFELEITHRWKGGIHAPHNNTKDAGISYCTGHLHSQKVHPWTDLRGDRWGVDTGTMAEVFNSQPDTPQFAYLEGHPGSNWRSGFAVFTFREHKLMPPELVQVIQPGVVWFRGEWIEV